MVVFSSLFLPLLPKFCLFYLLQAQFHYSWCRTRHSFGVAVIGRLLFFLEERDIRLAWQTCCCCCLVACIFTMHLLFSSFYGFVYRDHFGFFEAEKRILLWVCTMRVWEEIDAGVQACLFQCFCWGSIREGRLRRGKAGIWAVIRSVGMEAFGLYIWKSLKYNTDCFVLSYSEQTKHLLFAYQLFMR